MAFSGQMHNIVRLVLSKNAIQFTAVTNINLFKRIALVIGYGSEPFQVASVGQNINYHHAVIGIGNEMTYNAGTNESTTAGYNNTIHFPTPLVSKMKV